MLFAVVSRHGGRRCSSSSFRHITSRAFAGNKTSYPSDAPAAAAGFQLRRALIVSKLSRFEFEQLRYPDLNAVQLEQKIRDRGTDYDSLISYNEQHVDFRRQVVDCFKRNNVEVKVVDRSVTGVIFLPKNLREFN